MKVPYVIDSIRGYFQGVSPTHLEGQGLSDVYGPGYGSTAYADDIAPTPQGAITSLGGYSRVVGLADALFDDRINAVTYWRPSVGGDYIFLTYDSAPHFLARHPFTGNWTLRNVVSIQDSRYRSRKADPYIVGHYEAYGDALYYVDGVNPPLRISIGRSGFPEAMAMGVPPPGSSDILTVERKPVPAISALRGGVYTYAMTAFGRWGESSAATFRFDTLSTLPDTESSTQYGPTGFCPVLAINWTGVDESVQSINIYRSTLFSDQLQFVARIPRGISSFVDSRRDSELGLPIPQDLGAPVLFRLLRSFDDRMFGVGGYGNPNRLAVSKRLYPDVWPILYEVDTGVIGAGEQITQMWVINGSLYIFCRERTFRLTGFSPEDYSLEQVSSYLGCIAPRSLQPWRDGVVLLSTKGVQFFNGGQFTPISSPIDTLFRDTPKGSVDVSYASGAVVGDMYYLSYNDAGHGVTTTTELPNRVMVGNLATGMWGVREDGAFLAAAPMTRDQALAVGSQSSSANSKYLYLLSNYPYKDHRRSTPVLPFKNLDMGHPKVMKTIHHVEVWYEALKETPATLVLYREAPQIDFEEATHTPTFTESDTENPSNEPTTPASDPTTPKDILAWGDNWALSVATATMQVRRARFTFAAMTGKSFAMALSFRDVVGEVLVQKILFDVEVTDPSFEGYVRDGVSGFGGA